jgi:hypothetical protein
MHAQIALLKDACELLQAILEAWAGKKGALETRDIRRSYINRHAWNIHDLAGDVITLSDAKNLGSIYLLSRPALESLFKLSAAVANEKFASEKVVAEVDEERRKMEKWLKSADAAWAKTLTLMIKGLGEFKAELRARYSVAQEREWKTFEVAKLGGLESEYVRDYFIGSKHVHAMLSALTDRECQMYIPEALYRLTVVVAHTCALVNKALIDLENCAVTAVFEKSLDLRRLARFEFEKSS